jgi:hypothetical protein
MTIRIHLDEITDLDPNDKRLHKKRVIMPKPPNLSGVEIALLESALGLYSRMDMPLSPLVKDNLDFRNDPARNFQILGKLKHMRVRRPSANLKTVGLGPSASAGVGLSIGVTQGVFFASTVPHVGFYGSVDLGIVTNATASITTQLLLCWASQVQVFKGPPVIIAGANVSVPGVPMITGGGFLMFFDLRPRKLELFGVGYQVGVGVSLLPLDVFVSTGFGTSTI